MRYPSEDIEAMRQVIEENDERKFSMIFDIFMEYAQNFEVPIFMRICACYDVINALFKVLMDMEDETVSKDFSRRYSLSAIGGHEFSWHIEVMKALRDQVLSLLERQSKSADELLDRIKAFVADHYLDSDFSAQRVADELHMNLSNVSAYFKNRTRINLIQYITTYKMNYAINLLKTSDLSLAEIAEKTGYATPSSFIRKFKQYTRVTPGEYKKAFDLRNKTESGE